MNNNCDPNQPKARLDINDKFLFIFIVCFLFVSLLIRYIDKVETKIERSYYNNYTQCYDSNEINVLLVKDDPANTLGPEFSVERVWQLLTKEKVEAPSDLSDYKLLPENNMGMFENYDRSTRVFSEALDYMTACAKSWISSDNSQARDVALDFIVRSVNSIQNTVEWRCYPHIPWGTNARIFEVKYSTFATLCLLGIYKDKKKNKNNKNKNNDDNDDDNNNIILCKNIIRNFGLGVQHDKFFTDELIRYFYTIILRYPTFRNIAPSYARQLALFRPSSSLSEGVSRLYRDGTMITRGNIISYVPAENFKEIYGMLCAVDRLFPKRNTFQQIDSILLHPSVQYGGPINLYNRATSDLTVPTNNESPLGLRVMPYSGIIRMFGSEYSFLVRCVTSHFAYFSCEPDSDNDMLQDSLFSRISYTKNTKKDQYPNFNNILSEEGKHRVKIDSSCGLSGLFADKASYIVICSDKCGYSYQNYSLDLSVVKLGEFHMIEETILDYDKNSVQVNLKYRSSKNTLYYGNEMHQYKKNKWIEKSFNIDCTTNTVSNVKDEATFLNASRGRLNANHEICRLNNNTQCIMYVDNVAKYAFDASDVISYEKVFDGQMFKYDAKQNQYTRSDKCVNITEITNKQQENQG